MKHTKTTKHCYVGLCLFTLSALLFVYTNKRWTTYSKITDYASEINPQVPSTTVYVKQETSSQDEEQYKNRSELPTTSLFTTSIDYATENTSVYEAMTTKPLLTSSIEYTTENSSDYETFTAQRFARRFKQMHKRCIVSHPMDRMFQPNANILVNENHNLEVCVVPKSGSTSWHKLVFKMRLKDEGRPLSTMYMPSITPFNHRTSFKILNRTRFDQWTMGVDDDFFTEPNPQAVYRVITGRHPFARLISAWNQKMLKQVGIWESFYQRYPMLKLYNKTAPNDKNHVMSWEDFAEYVSDIQRKKGPMDYHFIPAAELCRQCNYFFTYVVKLETLSEDYKWLSKRINLSSDLELGAHGSPFTGSMVNANPAEKITQYMKRLLSDVVARLYQLYKQDFIDFGYTFNLETFETGGFD